MPALGPPLDGAAFLIWQVNTFIFKAERALNAKVSLEELDRVKQHIHEQLSDCRDLLQAQMLLVTEKVQVSEVTVSQVKHEMDHVAKKISGARRRRVPRALCGGALGQCYTCARGCNHMCARP